MVGQPGRPLAEEGGAWACSALPNGSRPPGPPRPCGGHSPDVATPAKSGAGRPVRCGAVWELSGAHRLRIPAYLRSAGAQLAVHSRHAIGNAFVQLVACWPRHSVSRPPGAPGATATPYTAPLRAAARPCHATRSCSTPPGTRLAIGVARSVWGKTDERLVPLIYEQLRQFHLQSVALWRGGTTSYSLRRVAPGLDIMRKRSDVNESFYLSGLSLLNNLDCPISMVL